MTMARTAKALGLVLGLASATYAQDPSKFEIKLEEKKAFYQEMTTKVVQDIKVQGGLDSKQSHEQTFYFAWTPEKFDKDKGTWTLKQKIEGVKMSIDIAGNPVKYDSTDKSTTATTNPGLADFYKNLKDVEWTITLKGGAVEKVDGKDELLKKLGSANSQLEALLRKILSDDAVKQMADPSFGLSPGKEVKKDEEWTKKSLVNLGPIGSYDITYKYKYAGFDPTNKELLRVEVTPTIEYKAPAETTEGLLFRIKSSTMKSEQPKPGFINFDPKTGRIVQSQMTVQLKGELMVTVGGTDTKVELNQEQTTTINTKDVSFVNPVVPATTTTTPPMGTTPAPTPAPTTPMKPEEKKNP